MKDIQFNHDAESGIESLGLDHTAFNRKLATVITLFFATTEDDEISQSKLAEFLINSLTDTEILFLASCQAVDIIKGFGSSLNNQIINN